MKQGLKIVFEDEWLIVVEKPSGMLTMATDKGREVTAYSMLYDYVLEEALQNGSLSPKSQSQGNRGSRSRELQGKDIRNLINDLIDHFRNLMVCKVSTELDEIISLPEETIKLLKDQSKIVDVNDLIRILNILSETLLQNMAKLQLLCQNLLWAKLEVECMFTCFY